MILGPNENKEGGRYYPIKTYHDVSEGMCLRHNLKFEAVWNNSCIPSRRDVHPTDVIYEMWLESKQGNVLWDSRQRGLCSQSDREKHEFVKCYYYILRQW